MVHSLFKNTQSGLQTNYDFFQIKNFCFFHPLTAMRKRRGNKFINAQTSLNLAHCSVEQSLVTSNKGG